MMAQGAYVERSRRGAKMKRQDMRKGTVNNTTRGRMNVCVDAVEDASEWYGRGAEGVLGLGFSGKLRQPVTDTAYVEPAPVISRKGVRHNWGVVMIALFCFVLALSLIMGMVANQSQRNAVNNLTRSIASQKRLNEVKEQTLAQKASDINVGYQAAQMNMIPAKSVDVISITLPATAAAPVTLTGDVIGSDKLAAILGE